MLSEELSLESLLNEVAFHEASHFVFQLLIIKEYSEFNYPDSITVSVKFKERFEGEVYGFSPKVIDKAIKSDIYKERCLLNAFYLKPQNVYYYCFQKLAGFNSFKAFIKNRIEYFALLNYNDGLELKEKNSVNYYSLEKAPNMYGSLYIKDINDCHNKLTSLGYGNKLSKDKYLKELIKDIDKVMGINEVRQAITEVKNILEINNGKKIEGQEFKDLIDKTNNHVKGINLMKLINHKLLNND